MRRIIILIFFGSLINLAIADGVYQYNIDLVNVANDKVTVVLTPPNLTESEIVFKFPAMVPGTYEVYDFGRFISNLNVVGKNGALITVTKIDVNTYKFKPANKILSIQYQVDDTFDKTDLPKTKEKIIFEPGGTNFEVNKNFSINSHSMFGYFAGHMNEVFTLNFQKPKGFYPSTGLSDISIGAVSDVIKVNGYYNLADAPIMYFLPDTCSIKVANTNVLVSCYSPNKVINSGFIARTLNKLLNAQKDYLGGQLPVDKYAFLFYFADKPTQSGASGALEHSYSSFYVLPEYDSLSMEQTLRDVTAHEFFHIITPLNIHSKEIGEFDFNNPQMSEHLWLYEGMTEYAAHHAQLKGGIINLDQFLNTMMQKYQTSIDGYNDTMSFTYMSKHVLEEKIHTQYTNVYEKGAVIGMCLDIILRSKSKGSYGTQDLMNDLATKYGKNVSFEDSNLFNDIEKFTYPEVGDFLRNHVGGTKPLPITHVLDKVGIKFAKESVSDEFSLGNPELSYNQKTNRLVIESIKEMDEFGMLLGFKRKDELSKLNGVEFKPEKIREIITQYYDNLKEGDNVSVEVYRPGFFKGKFKKKTLTAKALKVRVARKNQITLAKEMSDIQKLTLKKWISN
jgi:predicted metalloprotease with PDZ domain